MSQSLDNLFARLNALQKASEEVEEKQRRYHELKLKWYENTSNNADFEACRNAELAYHESQSWLQLKVLQVLDVKRELEILGEIRTDG